MNLRNTTIWTTGTILIVTVLAIFVDAFAFGGTSNFNFSTLAWSATTIFGFVYFCSMLWLFTGSPAAVSFIIARKLKYNIPAFVLLVSTVAYGLLFLCAQYWFFADTNSCTRGFWLLMSMGALWWMVPAWITAIVLEIRHRKKQAEP